MKGLEFLKSRELDTKIDFKEKELRYGVKIPPKFLLFLNLYDVTQFNQDYLYWEKNKFKYPLNGPIYAGRLNEDGRDSLSFEEFLEPENIFGIYEMLEEYEEDEWGLCTRKFIPFGVSGIYNNGGGFMVGTIGDDCDKIFIDTEDEEDEANRFQVIENDIFDFVRKFQLKSINLGYVSKDISLENLYKNWGEDFWRVKEESKTKK